jgi:phage/plasmid primase-like uncharacterized protein
MTYDDVAHYLGIDDPQGRHTCPVCGSSDGLGIDPDQGDTGTAHCFSCGFGETEPGTGAQLYAEVERVEIAEALQAFGIDGSDLSRKVKQREDTAPRPRVPEKTDAELDEQRRAWHAMTPGELQLRDEYRRRRALAAHDRDRDEFDRWHSKFEALHEHVLQREMAAHRAVDRLDLCVSEPQQE